MNTYELLCSIFCDPEGNVVSSLESEGDTKVLHAAIAKAKTDCERMSEAERVIDFYANHKSATPVTANEYQKKYGAKS